MVETGGTNELMREGKYRSRDKERDRVTKQGHNKARGGRRQRERPATVRIPVKSDSRYGFRVRRSYDLGVMLRRGHNH